MEITPKFLEEEVSLNRDQLKEAARHARISLEKLSRLLHDEVALDARIDEIPEVAWKKDFLYHLFLAYAQGEDSLEIFAEEENIPYNKVNALLNYFNLEEKAKK